MLTHQEVQLNNQLYNKYKDQRILFSTSVAKSIGLQQSETILKIGMEKTKGALISATMNDMVILAKMTEALRRRIYSENGMVTVHLKFFDSLFKKEMIFNLYTKFVNMNNHGLPGQDMQYLSLKLRRRIPYELVSVFGKHHTKVSTASTVLNKKAEGMLFARGIKKNCFPSYIDNEKVMINFLGNPQSFVNHKAMIVLKSPDTGETYEIIGKIDEQFEQNIDAFQMRLNYSIDQQSPRFTSSLGNLKELINISN
ncbi:PilZN3 domain-containing protein [Spirochaeta isovalerica]|uniref:PilZN3 domain-containing protein n=1 Tax=Spirochaeta isovalerica TaxID=150 RepID=A0A841R9B6_9SPIO|nr:PilZN3 domain-containing protein [Spirochaeta isovalerica]MBB6480493.1 hypothetical protein [Spirochaeta isovalerica]